ncbi:MAG: homoserine kinase [Pseudanabaenaceae cyanobacterium]|jgi:homoserine kinase
MTYTVSVPATTGNLGPGFDCLGAALSLYNRFTFAHADQLQITAVGNGADQVERDEKNLVYQGVAKVYTKLGQPVPPFSLHIETNIPLSRGLGSSATAIVGGIFGGNLLAGSPLSQMELLNLAIEMEGHPDNVAPAVLGGCQLMADSPTGEWLFCSLQWHSSLAVVVAIPDFELSTALARQVLPKSVSMHDAVFNAAHLALLTHALQNGNPTWLQGSLQDRLHQPYRQSLIKGMAEVQAAALDAGAYGMVISGAGPTLLAIVPTANPQANDQPQQVAQAMTTAWQNLGITSRALCLAIANDGTTVTTH